ncbi:MAG: GAF domain-containing protein [Thermoanaerobaculum sp.]|nr:GAF domain-containing protein [Thermoanaerobaculum sp.]MCX7894404.1 GAF domain-containing protein [Thermoanaerobaculum sp.]MDW7967918.1 GAF domain-containing protein [Thermoanaerobaculum sp.]
MSDQPGGWMAGGESSKELVEELKGTLEKARELVRELEAKLARAGVAVTSAGEGDLAQRLARTEADVKELATQLAASERQISRLMNLYVATYQLHATLTPEEVLQTIAEIAVNLLGADAFALILRRDGGTGFEVALAQGLASGPYAVFSGPEYQGGDPAVDATLADGMLRLAPIPNSPAVAVVPLKVQGEIVGVLVVLKLLPHKPALRPEDRELLDLLSAHAASALFAARIFASKDRRLRTLESLIKLARGE